jgi:ATP-dependent helicase/nuclease subunit B
MNKITVVSLRENFLKTLAEEISSRHFLPDAPLSLAQVTVVLPHRRGIIYFRDYLFQVINAERRRPFFPPRIIAIEDLVEEIAVQMEDPPCRRLLPPDQTWVLFGIVHKDSTYGKAAESWDRFFPWGIRLAALLDEIDRELVFPQDIRYPEDVPWEAKTLLEGLEEIYVSFDRQLRAEELTTPAKRLRLLAQQIEKAPMGKGPTYLAGFYALTAAEERIFKHLFSQGAKVFWHADPNGLPPLYTRWKEQWNVEIEAMGDTIPASPRLHFYESYDLHAELLQAQEILPAVIQRPDQCALVLPDPSALIPTLYSLPPRMPVNVSLGYPLERTALASLVEQLMRLQEGRDAKGAYYHQDYLILIRHPYLRRLTTPTGKEGRICLHFLEEKIRHYGKPFLSRNELVDVLVISDDPARDRHFLAIEGLDVGEAQEFIRQLHDQLLAPWEELRTPAEMAVALKGLMQFLFAPFVEQEAFLHSHPLDNEFIHTLEDSVIPGLEDALFAHHPMDKQLLFSLLRELLHMARTPFEGHPLVGLQLLGLLETRLLSFDKVLVIDVNENVIPAQEEVNPLLPEPLKGVFGLAGREHAEALVRYHFERLIASANEAHLLWQSSVTPTSSGTEGKKVRSRFIESLLWHEEKKQGIVLEGTVSKAPVRIAGNAFLREEGLAKRGREHEQVRQFLSSWSRTHGLSASLLNTYLQCPLKFYYHYLLGLRPIVTVPDEVDAAALGEIVHQVLEEYFSRYLRQTYRKRAENDPERLISIFRRHFTGSPMYRTLAPEKRFFLEYVAAYRLEQYLSQMPESTFVASLEEEHRLDLSLGSREFTFYGKVDRIDRRGTYRHILDYKTGTVQQFAKGHFERKILPFSLPLEFNYEGLKDVAEVIKDLQLPLYALLVAAGKEEELRRTLTAYVELGRRGEERYFIPPERLDGLGDAAVVWFSRTFPLLLAYIIDHAIEAPLFYPTTEEETCRFCEYESICRYSSVA